MRKRLRKKMMKRNLLDVAVTKGVMGKRWREATFRIVTNHIRQARKNGLLCNGLPRIGY